MGGSGVKGRPVDFVYVLTKWYQTTHPLALLLN